MLMKKKIKRLINHIYSIPLGSNPLVDNQIMLNARVLQALNEGRQDKIINQIQLAEFKVYSQFGDDGIIQFLVNYLDFPQKNFIEFGVEDYTEANTRFLLTNNNWSGMVMDGSEENINKIKQQSWFWRYDLIAEKLFVDKDNINSFIHSHGFSGDIGLLHIDIDGNDYWIWKNVEVIKPVLVIVEYNSVFGSQQPWTVDYDPAFIRTNYHHSNLYWGTSLLSLCDLAEEKGYSFIGCNSNGNNAYFVRNDKMSGLKKLSCEEGFVMSKFRESRSKDGQLTYLSGEERIKALSGMKIYNTRNKNIEYIK